MVYRIDCGLRHFKCFEIKPPSRMGFQDLLVTEIFHSLQGETSFSGLRTVFIRLTGCNLRCTYCDSSYAFHGGERLSIQNILDQIRPYQTKDVLITGGEPLLQRQTLALVQALNQEFYRVSIETHGEVSIAEVSPHVRIVMDVKTPGSKMARMGFLKNIPYLKKGDEVKFVLTSKNDYDWAAQLLQKTSFEPAQILFSPALISQKMPGPNFEPLELSWLANQILKDRLNVRLQIQLHKQIWGADTKGV